MDELLAERAKRCAALKEIDDRIESARKFDEGRLRELSEQAQAKCPELVRQITEAYRIGETLVSGLRIEHRLNIPKGCGPYIDLIGDDPDQRLAREWWTKYRELTLEFGRINPAPDGAKWNGCNLFRPCQ